MVGFAGAGLAVGFAAGFAGEGGRAGCLLARDVCEEVLVGPAFAGKGFGAANFDSNCETFFDWLGFFSCAGLVVFGFEEISRAPSWRVTDAIDAMAVKNRRKRWKVLVGVTGGGRGGQEQTVNRCSHSNHRDRRRPRATVLCDAA